MFMPDDDTDRPLIRNEDTLRRRAWIDRALAGVRDRLKPDEIGELAGPAQPVIPAVTPADPVADGAATPAARPNLYLIRNRRSY
jgi:hypothetical protein